MMVLLIGRSKFLPSRHRLQHLKRYHLRLRYVVRRGKRRTTTSNTCGLLLRIGSFARWAGSGVRRGRGMITGRRRYVSSVSNLSSSPIYAPDLFIFSNADLRYTTPTSPMISLPPTARHVLDHHRAHSQTMILGPAAPTTIHRLRHLTPQITPLRSPSPFRSISTFAIQPELYIRIAGKTVLGMRPVAVAAPIQHIYSSLHRAHLPLRVPHVLRAEYSAARLGSF
jgi:hypothetical protein